MDLSHNSLSILTDDVAEADDLLGRYWGCYDVTLLQSKDSSFAGLLIACPPRSLFACLHHLLSAPACTLTLSPPPVLDLSYNKLSDLPFSFLVRVTDLRFLDLSHNQLKTLPPQFRRSAFMSPWRCLSCHLVSFVISITPVTFPTRRHSLNCIASVNFVTPITFVVTLSFL